MRHHLVILSLWAALTLSPVAGSNDEPRAQVDGAMARPNRLQPFEMPDQHGARHVVSFPRERLLLLTVADREGSEQVNDWVEPIHREYEARLEIVGVAQLGPVPTLFRARILRELRRAYDRPLLLDWTGDMSESMGAHRKRANIYLIDTQGEVLHHCSGPATASALAGLRKAIEGVLDQAGTRS